MVNEYDVANLRSIFLDYGELRNAPALARAIVEAREERPIKTTDELKQVLANIYPKKCVIKY